MSNNVFGIKLREIREYKGLSQSGLGRRLGHRANSYVQDIENGVFIPPADKLAPLASALGVPVAQLEEIALESKIIALGINDPGFVSMFKDYVRLSNRDKRAIVKNYQEITRGVDGPHLK